MPSASLLGEGLHLVNAVDDENAAERVVTVELDGDKEA